MNKQKIAVFDIDGTLFRSGLYREVVFELIRTNKIPNSIKNELIPEELAWQIRKSDDSFKIYSDKIVEILERNLDRISVDDYDRAAQTVIDKMGQFCYRYTKNLLTKLQAQNYYTITISGSPDRVVEIFARLHGFDLAIGSSYEITDDGYFLQSEATPTWKNKHLILEQTLDWKRFTLKDSYGVGDTSGDISMLKLVANPIAFNPDQDLFIAAKNHNWPIVIERKNMIFELESKAGQYLLKI